MCKIISSFFSNFDFGACREGQRAKGKKTTQNGKKKLCMSCLISSYDLSYCGKRAKHGPNDKNYVRRTPYLRKLICKMMTYPDAFFIFSKF